MLTNEADFSWAGWLANGGTFTPEAWQLSGSANSGSHGWGARGIVDVYEDVLGIEVSAPGAAEPLISVPDTGLGSAEGSLMTQRGRVSTSWTRDGDAASLEATVPVNVSAVVELPAGEYDVAGPGGAPAQALGTEGGFTRYRVGSGTGSFEQAS